MAAIHTFHTSGGLILRFPTLADQDGDFPRADLEAYGAIAKDGVAITGYTNFAYDGSRRRSARHRRTRARQAGAGERRVGLG